MSQSPWLTIGCHWTKSRPSWSNFSAWMISQVFSSNKIPKEILKEKHFFIPGLLLQHETELCHFDKLSHFQIKLFFLFSFLLLTTFWIIRLKERVCGCKLRVFNLQRLMFTTWLPKYGSARITLPSYLEITPYIRSGHSDNYTLWPSIERKDDHRLMYYYNWAAANSAMYTCSQVASISRGTAWHRGSFRDSHPATPALNLSDS